MLLVYVQFYSNATGTGTVFIYFFTKIRLSSKKLNQMFYLIQKAFGTTLTCKSQHVNNIFHFLYISIIRGGGAAALA